MKATFASAVLRPSAAVSGTCFASARRLATTWLTTTAEAAWCSARSSSISASWYSVLAFLWSSRARSCRCCASVTGCLASSGTAAIRALSNVCLSGPPAGFAQAAIRKGNQSQILMVVSI